MLYVKIKYLYLYKQNHQLQLMIYEAGKQAGYGKQGTVHGIPN